MALGPTSLSGHLRRIWRSRRWPAWGLLPLAWLYGLLARWPRWLYQRGWRQAQHPGIPTLVIGNVIAGGAGKTPVTLATVRHLQQRGWRPGIVSRGYGRSSAAGADDCRPATPDSHPQEVGDEPLLLARASGAPVYVARQRIQAARALRQAHPEVNILLCDDGLQHLALARDLEICVFNDEGAGNGWLLPAGPLREPWPRHVDAVLHTPACSPAQLQPLADTPCFALERQLASEAVAADGQRIPLARIQAWQAQQGRALYALAAIARPEDFFQMLRAQGLTLAGCLPLPDHHDLSQHDFSRHPGWPQPKDASGPDSPLILCTEKDAAKIWPRYPSALAVPLRITIHAGYYAWLDAQLQRLAPAAPAASLTSLSHASHD